MSRTIVSAVLVVHVQRRVAETQVESRRSRSGMLGLLLAFLLP